VNLVCHFTSVKGRVRTSPRDVGYGEASRASVNHGRPVAKLVPVQPVPRQFGQLPNLLVPRDFDESLPESELARWEGDANS
jgi:hypothetical protein